MRSPYYITALVIVLFLSSFLSKDRTDLLARRWIMESMQVEGTQVTEEMMERQRRNGLVTVLRFTSNGQCYIYIKSPKGGQVTKKNRWQFLDDQTRLAIQPENETQTQIFTIDKLSSKKMTLSLEDKENGVTQVFSYKAVK